MSLSVYMLVCVSARVFVCLYVSLSMCVSARVFVCQSVSSDIVFVTGMSDLGPNWARLSSNGTNLKHFKISFHYILIRRVKMY